MPIALWLREWDRAYELLQSELSLDSTSQMAFIDRGGYYLTTKDYDKAVENLGIALNLRYEGRDHIVSVIMHTSFYGMALWLSGRKDEGEKLIHESLNKYLKLNMLSTSDRELRIATIHAFLRNRKEAYDWLRKSKWTWTALYEVNLDVWFSNINQEQEFKNIVDSVKAERRKVREEIVRLKAAGQWELK